MTRLLIIIYISLLSACAGNAVKDSDNIQAHAMEQAKQTDQSPEIAILAAQDLQIEAQREDLYFYSPNYMKQAEKALNNANESLNSQKPAHEIIAFALSAQTYFKRGLENKPNAQSILKDTFNGLEMLKAIKADSILASDFKDLEDETKDLIILIEQGRSADALNEQKDLLEEINEVEIKTLEKTFLSPARTALNKAEDSDAEDYASKTFAQAESAVKALSVLITTTPKQQEQIKASSIQATHMAQHANNIAQAAKPLLKLNNETAEDHILFIESLLSRINLSLEQESIIHLPLDSQSIAIAQAAETINKRASTQTKAQNDAEAWEKEKAELILEIEKLKAAQKMTPTNEPINTSQESTKITEEPVIAPNDPAKTPENLTEATEEPAISPENLSKATEEPVKTPENLTKASEEPATSPKKDAPKATDKANDVTLEAAKSAEGSANTNEVKRTPNLETSEQTTNDK